MLYASLGRDKLKGGKGSDWVVVDYSGQGPLSFKVLWNMQIGVLRSSDAGVKNQAHNVENLRLMGEVDTKVIGNAEDNVLIASSGADVLLDYSGSDVLRGGGGADNLRGSKGNDWLYGGSGNDTLDGGRDRDRLDRRSGNDKLVGGSGDDIFIFRDGDGRDVITDFDATVNREKIDLSAITAIRSITDLRNNHMTQDGADVVIDTGDGNTITQRDVDVAELSGKDFLL